MELSDEAKAEIKEAIRILKEDGVHIHKTYKAFMDSLNQGDPTADDKNTEGKPPPEKTPPEGDEGKPPKKAGLWWGNRDE